MQQLVNCHETVYDSSPENSQVGKPDGTGCIESLRIEISHPDETGVRNDSDWEFSESL